MAIRITGVLRDSTGNLSPNTAIQVTTTVGFGETLTSATSIHKTDQQAKYDFNLVAGKHKIEVRYKNTYHTVGEVGINSETEGVFTLSQVLDLSEPPSDPNIAELTRILNEANEISNSIGGVVEETKENADAAKAQADIAKNAAESIESDLFDAVGVITQAVKDDADRAVAAANSASDSSIDAEEFALRAELAAENAESGSGGGGVNISIAGQSFAVRGQSVTWHITDFDEFSPYETTVPVGAHGAISGQFFILRVDADYVGDTLEFEIKRDSFGKKFNVRVMDQAIEKPVITFPTMGDVDVPLRTVFESSEFMSVPENFIHTQSQWQLSVFPDFSINQIDTGESANLTSLNILQYAQGGLFGNEDYYLRVRYIGTRQGVTVTSEWSDAQAFKTLVAADGVWRKTADYNVNVAESNLKTMFKAGEFLGVVEYREVETVLSTYNRFGDLIARASTDDGIFSNDHGDYRRLTLSISHPTTYEDPRLYISTYGTVVEGSSSTTSANASFELSMSSGAITRSAARSVSSSSIGTTEELSYWRCMHISRINESGTQYLTNNIYTVSPNSFVTTAGTSSTNFNDMLTSSYSNFITDRPAMEWSAGGYICNLMSAVNDTSVLTGASCEFNFVDGLVHHSQSNPDLATITHTIRTMTPSIGGTFDLDTVILSNPIDYDVDNFQMSKAVMFCPNPDNRLNTPILVDLNGVGNTDVIQGQVINTANYPNLKDPSVVGYTANAIGRHNDNSFSSLQVLAKVGETIQVWELDCSHLM